MSGVVFNSDRPYILDFVSSIKDANQFFERMLHITKFPTVKERSVPKNRYTRYLQTLLLRRYILHRMSRA